MKAPVWVIEHADWFWQLAGTVEPVPRSLRGAAVRVFQGLICPQPALTVRTAIAWLRDRKVDLPGAAPDRPLRACLVAHSGDGVIFIDSTDPPDEQRFSLAHELAHYLRDYLVPRRRAAMRLGPAALEVLDGWRPPSPTERLHALLGRVDLKVHVHLMERRRPDHAVTEAEESADRLAYELLAPAAVVVREDTARRRDQRGVADLLRGKYGLPACQAQDYSLLLLPPAPAPDPVLLRLRSGP